MDERPCNDCGAVVGEGHQGGCDVARCLWTGMQAIQCEMGLIAECCRALRNADRADLADGLARYHGLDDPGHDCGRDVWMGEYPGAADAVRLGLWTVWTPQGWKNAQPHHPEATPDLNRLMTEARWDREAKRWVAREAERRG